MTQDFKLKDYDLAGLERNFNLKKEKLLQTLRQKLINIESFQFSDICDISVRGIEDLRAFGQEDWDNFVTIVKLSAVRKNKSENDVAKEIVANKAKARPTP